MNSGFVDFPLQAAQNTVKLLQEIDSKLVKLFAVRLQVLAEHKGESCHSDKILEELEPKELVSKLSPERSNLHLQLLFYFFLRKVLKFTPFLLYN